MHYVRSGHSQKFTVCLAIQTDEKWIQIVCVRSGALGIPLGDARRQRGGGGRVDPLTPPQFLHAGGELSLASRELRFALFQLLPAGVQPLADLLQAVLRDFGVRDELLLGG